MKNLLRKHIREQVSFLLKEEQIEQIKSMEDGINKAEEEIKNTEKEINDARKQQQNYARVTSTQVGTLGDTSSRDIKTKDVKKNVELYKNRQDELKGKLDLQKKELQLKKSQLGDLKATAAQTSITATTPPPTS